MQDVSLDNHRAERDAAQKADALRLLMENMEDYALVIMDVGRCVTQWNAGAERLFGWREREILGRSADTFFTPEDCAAGCPEREAALAREQSRAEGERWHLRKDGSRFWGRVLTFATQGNGDRPGYIKIFRDLTQRRQREQEFFEQQDETQAALTAGEVGAWTYFVAENVVYANSELTRFFAAFPTSTEGNTSEHFINAIHRDDQARVTAALGAAWENGTPFEEDFRIQQLDGSYLWVISRGRRTCDAVGRPTALRGVLFDITDRKKITKDLRITQERLAIANSAAQIGTWDFYPVSGVLEWDNQCKALFGLPPQARVEYRDFLAGLHPDDREKTHQVVLRALEPTGNGHYDIAYRTLTPDGRLRWCRATGRAFFGEVEGQKQAVRFIGTIQDITERIQAEEALRASQIGLQLALTAGQLGYWQLDLATRMLEASATCLQNFSLNASPFPYATLLQIIHPEDRPMMEAAVAQALETHSDYHAEYRIVVAGEVRWIEASGRGFYGEDGKPTRLAGTTRDITRRTQEEEEARHRQAEIEALNERLKRAMQETHHRVKNNLQVIAALVEMQAEEAPDGFSAAPLRRINQHVQALAVIHDLLTQQSKTDTELSHVRVRAVLERLTALLKNTLGGYRSLRVAVEDAALTAEKAASLSLLVSECVSNAVKHSAGDIEIALSVSDGIATLAICDNGSGFPSDFDPREAANTGLQLIENAARWDLRGEVRYETRPEGGGQVVITFPVEPIAPIEPEPLSP